MLLKPADFFWTLPLSARNDGLRHTYPKMTGLAERFQRFLQLSWSTKNPSMYKRNLAENLRVFVKEAEPTAKGCALWLQIALTGIHSQDIVIEVTADDILVKADLHHEHTQENGDVRAGDFGSGTLFRPVHLPQNNRL
jgi:HSP20 family molecular chaperone IbpA